MAINTAQWQLTLHNGNLHGCTMAINTAHGCTMAINTAQWQLTLHNGNYTAQWQLHCTMAINTAQWQLTLHNGN